MLGSDHWDRNAGQRLPGLSLERFPTKAGRAPMADAVFDLQGQARSVPWTRSGGATGTPQLVVAWSQQPFSRGMPGCQPPFPGRQWAWLSPPRGQRVYEALAVKG